MPTEKIYLQQKLIGNPGQYVKFDSNGDVVALTQTIGVAPQILVYNTGSYAVECKKESEEVFGSQSDPIEFYPTSYGQWTIYVKNGETVLDSRIINVDEVKQYTYTYEPNS